VESRKLELDDRQIGLGGAEGAERLLAARRFDHDLDPRPQEDLAGAAPGEARWVNEKSAGRR
jgi:hypothetical protein